jgi:hypothetical protein
MMQFLTPCAPVTSLKRNIALRELQFCSNTGLGVPQCLYHERSTEACFRELS